MQTAVSPYLAKLDRIEANLEAQAYKLIAEIQDRILDFVREEQLYKKGIDGKGVRLEPYSPYTIALKKFKGEVYNRTTLLDTGDFYDNMYVHARDRMYFVESSDHKSEMLKEKYGDSIMVLTDKNNKIINQEEILPRLIEWLISQLFGTT